MRLQQLHLCTGLQSWCKSIFSSCVYARKCLACGTWGEARPADLEKSKFWNRRDRFFFGAEGELCIRSVDPASPQGLLLLPRRLVPSMLDAFMINDTIAHPGTALTAENIQRLH